RERCIGQASSPEGEGRAAAAPCVPAYRRSLREPLPDGRVASVITMATHYTVPRRHSATNERAPVIRAIVPASEENNALPDDRGLLIVEPHPGRHHRVSSLSTTAGR